MGIGRVLLEPGFEYVTCMSCQGFVGVAGGQRHQGHQIIAVQLQAPVNKTFIIEALILYIMFFFFKIFLFISTMYLVLINVKSFKTNNHINKEYR